MKHFKWMITFLFLNIFISLNLYSAAPTKECVVLVCNKSYLPKFLKTVSELTTNGNYHGDICLVIGDDLVGDNLLKDEVIIKNNIIIKHFPDVKFPESFLKTVSKLPRYDKLFQYHKFYLLNPYFKKWDTILYIDCGMKIFADIRPILDTRKSNTLLAHSDAYPTYEWKLHCQFNKNDPGYSEFSKKYNLNIDYFQTGLLLYDTSIIKEDTFQNLYDLAVQYPLSNTNEQGIMALYFTTIVPLWEQIPLGNETTKFYDALRRNNHDKYIMSKYN